MRRVFSVICSRNLLAAGLIAAAAASTSCGTNDSRTVSAAHDAAETSESTPSGEVELQLASLSERIAQSPYRQAIDYSVPLSPAEAAEDASTVVHGRIANLAVGPVFESPISDAAQRLGNSAIKIVTLTLQINTTGAAGEPTSVAIPIWEGPMEQVEEAQAEYVQPITRLNVRDAEIVAAGTLDRGVLRPTGPSAVIVEGPGQSVDVLGAFGVAEEAWGSMALAEAERQMKERTAS